MRGFGGIWRLVGIQRALARFGLILGNMVGGGWKAVKERIDDSGQKTGLEIKGTPYESMCAEIGRPGN